MVQWLMMQTVPDTVCLLRSVGLVEKCFVGKPYKKMGTNKSYLGNNLQAFLVLIRIKHREKLVGS